MGPFALRQPTVNSEENLDLGNPGKMCIEKGFCNLKVSFIICDVMNAYDHPIVFQNQIPFIT
jgi:hypothetical protein